MNKLEFTESMAYLGLAYGKEYTPVEIEQAYDFLGHYSDQVFTQAVKDLIRKNRYLPKITEIIDACENSKDITRYEVVEYMKQCGYFKSPVEYDKTMHFLNRGIIPAWLLEVMRQYARRMKQERLGHNQQHLIA